MKSSMHPALPRPLAGQPSLSEVIRDAISSRLLDLHTAMPTKVVSYDPAKQTAELEPMIFGVIGDSDGDFFLETLPNLVNVPIAWFRAGGASFQMKLAPGDYVEVLFNESSWALWRTTGKQSEPGDLTRHGLSYPLGFPCIGPDSAALSAVGGGEGVVLDTGGSDVIRMGGASADFVALGSKVQAYITQLETDLVSAFAAITAPGGGPAVVTAFAANVALRLADKAAIPTMKLKGQ